jgi:serine/threonine-protein kinase
MGEVIEAEHVGLAKAVVVKLLHPDLSDEPRLVERMRIEARVLARLSHPNLVAVTDFGQTAGGRTYLVMERLHGRTFREELDARGPLSPLEAIDLAAQALAGLSAAHGAGVVHRDVKLENLFVCDPDAAGRRGVKVLDFGVAKLVAPADGGLSPGFRTAEGVLVGTPRCLAPEQVACRPVDARTDVYAMGIVLYTLLAGCDPFQHARRLGDLLRAHAAEVPVPPSWHAPWPIPAALERAVLRALEKDPDRRFASAAGFAAELGRVAAAIWAGEPAAAAPPPRWPVTERLDPGARSFPAPAGKAGCPPAPSPSLRQRGSGLLLALLLAGALLLGFALAALLRSGG